MRLGAVLQHARIFGRRSKFVRPTQTGRESRYSQSYSITAELQKLSENLPHEFPANQHVQATLQRPPRVPLPAAPDARC